MNRQKYFYEELVIGLGFASGLWLAVGIDPENVVVDSLLSLIKTPDLIFLPLFYVIPLIGTIFSILKAYNMGGKIGIGGVLFAFLGGIIILPPYSLAGVVLVLIGWQLGKLGVNSVISNKDYM